MSEEIANEPARVELPVEPVETAEPAALEPPHEPAATAAPTPPPVGVPTPLRWPQPEASPGATGSAVVALATPRPLLGPALRIYGALLWSYVVFGQFTTSWIDGRPLGEGWALLGVFATTAAVAVFSVRRSVKVAPTGALGIVRRTAAVVAIALLAWFATVAGVTLTRIFSGDAKTAFALVAMALAASIFGQRMNRDPEGTQGIHGQRVLQVMIWITLAVVTLVAGAELIAVG